MYIYKWRYKAYLAHNRSRHSSRQQEHRVLLHYRTCQDHMASRPRCWSSSLEAGTCPEDMPVARSCVQGSRIPRGTRYHNLFLPGSLLQTCTKNFSTVNKHIICMFYILHYYTFVRVYIQFLFTSLLPPCKLVGIVKASGFFAHSRNISKSTLIISQYKD